MRGALSLPGGHAHAYPRGAVRPAPLPPSAPVGEAAVRVSIVIPCLNEAQTIAECVRRARRALDANAIDGEVIVADNGSNWYMSGAPDPRWNDSELATLSSVKGSNFEVVQMGTIVAP